jgi:hypothetical protein
MANAWKSVDLIAAEALNVLTDELKITKMASRDKSAEFMSRPNGYAVGDTVRIKTNPEYTAKEFSTTVSAQDIRSSTRNMEIEKWYDVSVQMTSREKSLELNDFTDEVIRPAVIALAEQVETYVASKLVLARGLYASDDLFASASDVALARKAANYQQLNPAGRFAIVDDTMEAKLLGQTWFNQSQTRGAPGITTLQSGDMGRVMGIDWHGTQFFPDSSLTAGTMICATNNTSGTKNLVGDTSLIVDTQTASKALKVGDRIQIAGVRRPLVVKTAIADTSASTEIELAHPIDQIIPDDAAVTVVGSGQAMTFHGVIFDTDALGVAMPLLDPPSDKPAYSLAYDGISIRVVQGYDMSTKKDTLSLDLIVGATAYDPRRMTLVAQY